MLAGCQRLCTRSPASVASLAKSKLALFTSPVRVASSIHPFRMSSSLPDVGSIDYSLYEKVREGQAEILFPKDAKEVFYNPVQVFNRDLTIACIKQYNELRKAEVREQREKREKRIADIKAAGKWQDKAGGLTMDAKFEERGLRILEALGASGLRSVRFAKELPEVDTIVCNDFSVEAVENMKRNVAHNEVGDIIQCSHADASVLMLQNAGAWETQFDVIDLDPYGSPAPFLDGAVRSVRDGGLLCITATDMAVLCGNNMEACFAKYGSVPLHRKYCHEQALRILLYSMSVHAARYKRYIVPLMSLSVDFYIRVFVRVYTSAKEVKNVFAKMSYVHQSTRCDTFHLYPIGRIVRNGNSTKFAPGNTSAILQDEADALSCEKPCHIGGPLWHEPLHDTSFVQSLLQHINDSENLYAMKARISGIITAVSQELPDVPLYYHLPTMCRTLRVSVPPMRTFQSAILNAGFRVTQSHVTGESVKTDAPVVLLWDILREWVKQNPPKTPEAGSAAECILAQPQTYTVDFTIHEQIGIMNKMNRDIARYPLNPEENWGPKSRARIKKRKFGEAEDDAEKKAKVEEEGEGEQ